MAGIRTVSRAIPGALRSTTGRVLPAQWRWQRVKGLTPAIPGCSWKWCRGRVTEVRIFLTIERVSNHPKVSIVIVSKLTSKAQTTIPQPIRAALGLRPGDELSYEIVDGRVMLAKVQRGTTTDDPFRTFEEWGSEADTRAYADL